MHHSRSESARNVGDVHARASKIGIVLFLDRFDWSLREPADGRCRNSQPFFGGTKKNVFVGLQNFSPNFDVHISKGPPSSPLLMPDWAPRMKHELEESVKK